MINLKINIKNSEHVFIAGQTGSGKTYGANTLLSRCKNVVILDTKGLLDWVQSSYKKITDDYKKITFNDEYNHWVYRPDFINLNLDHYEEFFAWCYSKNNIIICVDELMQVCPSGTQYPEWLKGLYTRGRQKNISVWGCTQRPKGLPLFTMSEASHFMIYDLLLDADRQRILEIIEKYEVLKKPSSVSHEKHTFWYFDINNIDNINLCKINFKEVR